MALSVRGSLGVDFLLIVLADMVSPKEIVAASRLNLIHMILDNTYRQVSSIAKHDQKCTLCSD